MVQWGRHAIKWGTLLECDRTVQAVQKYRAGAPEGRRRGLPGRSKLRPRLDWVSLARPQPLEPRTPGTTGGWALVLLCPPRSCGQSSRPSTCLIIQMDGSRCSWVKSYPTLTSHLGADRWFQEPLYRQAGSCPWTLICFIQLCPTLLHLSLPGVSSGHLTKTIPDFPPLNMFHRHLFFPIAVKGSFVFQLLSFQKLPLAFLFFLNPTSSHQQILWGLPSKYGQNLVTPPAPLGWLPLSTEAAAGTSWPVSLFAVSLLVSPTQQPWWSL